MNPCAQNGFSSSQQLPHAVSFVSTKYSHMSDNDYCKNDTVSYLCQMCGRVSDSLEKSFNHTRSHLKPLVAPNKLTVVEPEMTVRSTENVTNQTCDHIQEGDRVVIVNSAINIRERKHLIPNETNQPYISVDVNNVDSYLSKNNIHRRSNSKQIHSMQTRQQKQSLLLSTRCTKNKLAVSLDTDSKDIHKSILNSHSKEKLEQHPKKEKKMGKLFSSANICKSASLKQQRQNIRSRYKADLSSCTDSVNKKSCIIVVKSKSIFPMTASYNAEQMLDSSQCKAGHHGMETRNKNNRTGNVCSKKKSSMCTTHNINRKTSSTGSFPQRKGDNRFKNKVVVCSPSSSSKILLCHNKNAIASKTTNKDNPSPQNPLVMLSDLASQNKKIKLLKNSKNGSPEAVHLENDKAHSKEFSQNSMWSKNKRVNILKDYTNDNSRSIKIMKNGILQLVCGVGQIAKDELHNVAFSQQKKNPDLSQGNSISNNVILLTTQQTSPCSKPNVDDKIVSVAEHNGQVAKSFLLKNNLELPVADGNAQPAVSITRTNVGLSAKKSKARNPMSIASLDVLSCSKFPVPSRNADQQSRVTNAEGIQDWKCKSDYEKMARIKFKCDRCFVSLNTTDDLKEHKKLCSSGELGFSSKLYRDIPADEALLCQDVSTNTATKNLQCSLKTGPEKPTCSNFRHQIVLDGVNRFKCTICGKLFREYVDTQDKDIQCNNTQDMKYHEWNTTQDGGCKANHDRKEENDVSESEVETNLQWDDEFLQNKIIEQDNITTQSMVPVEMPAEKTDNLFMCETCGKFFKRKDALAIHRHIHTGYKPFSCKICSKSLRDKHSYLCHFARHTGVRPYKCLKCDKSYVMRKQLIKHCITHTGRKPFQCKICAKAFTFLDNLKVHEKIHTKEKKAQCSICKDVFSDEMEMSTHKAKHFTKFSQSGSKEMEDSSLNRNVIPDLANNIVSVLSGVYCDICGKYFQNGKNLRRHRKNHRDKKLYECVVCNMTFRQSHILKLHRWKHAGVNLFKCGDCQTVFKSPVSLTSHKKEHTNTLMKCNVCVQTFTNRCALRAHKLSHGVHNFYSCQYCPKTFRTEKNLQKHAKNHIVDIQKEVQTEIPLEMEYDIICTDDIFPEVEDCSHGEVTINMSPTALKNSEKSIVPEESEMLTVAPFINNLCDVGSETLIIQSEIGMGDDATYDVSNETLLIQSNMEVNDVDNMSCDMVSDAVIIQSEIGVKENSQSSSLPSADSVYFAFTDNNIGTANEKVIGDETKKMDVFQEMPEDCNVNKHSSATRVSELVPGNSKSEAFTVMSLDSRQPKVGLTGNDSAERLKSNYGIATGFLEQPAELNRHLSEQEKPDGQTGKYLQKDPNLYALEKEALVFRDNDHDMQTIRTVGNLYDTVCTPSDVNTDMKAIQQNNFNTLTLHSEVVCDAHHSEAVCNEQHSEAVCNEQLSVAMPRENKLALGHLENCRIPADVEHMEIHNVTVGNTENIMEDTFMVDGNIEDHIQQFKVLQNPEGYGGEKSFVSKSSNKDSSHKERNEATKKCPICEKEFPRRKNLLEHLNTHVKLEFNCTVCNVRLTTLGDWTVHQKELHGLEIDHIFKQKPKGGNVLKCDYCGRNFNKQDNLNRHILTHTHEKPFQCKICGKRFSQSSSLGTHKTTHTDERKYNCSICDNKFKRKSNLQSHLKTHNTEKPHSCTMCGKTFREKSFLKNHMFTHSENKPHQCEFCKKSFADKSLLVKHERLHTDRFLCVICEKTFTRGSSLREHVKRSHGEGPSQSCDVCSKVFRNDLCLKKHKFSHSKIKEKSENVYILLH